MDEGGDADLQTELSGIRQQGQVPAKQSLSLSIVFPLSNLEDGKQEEQESLDGHLVDLNRGWESTDLRLKLEQVFEQSKSIFLFSQFDHLLSVALESFFVRLRHPFELFSLFVTFLIRVSLDFRLEHVREALLVKSSIHSDAVIWGSSLSLGLLLG